MPSRQADLCTLNTRGVSFASHDFTNSYTLISNCYKRTVHVTHTHGVRSGAITGDHYGLRRRRTIEGDRSKFLYTPNFCAAAFC